MPQTVPLIIETDIRNPDKITIHPNDGYDLKLYSLTYKIKVYSNCPVSEFQSGEAESFDGEILLSNDQKPGKVKIHSKFWDKLGKPQKAVLVYEDGKLLVACNGS